MKTCDRHKTVFKHECAECLHERSREEKAEQKAAEKFQNSLKKAKLKSLQQRKKVRPVSEKRRNDNKLYSIRRKKHLEQYPDCQIKLIGCTLVATQIHHVNGRIGSNLTNQKHFKSTCAHCHQLLHDKLSAKEAREKGLKG